MAKTVEVTVPDLGDFHDVAIIEIAVKPGETLRKDQPILTFETDKATMDLPSPSAGVLKELFVSIGTKVSKGSRIGSLEISEGNGEGATVKPSAAAKAAPAPAKKAAAAAPAPAKPAPPIRSVVDEPPAPATIEEAPGLAGHVRKPTSHKTPAPEELSAMRPEKL